MRGALMESKEEALGMLLEQKRIFVDEAVWT
jgi:hypothetical protein